MCECVLEFGHSAPKYQRTFDETEGRVQNYDANHRDALAGTLRDVLFDGCTEEYYALRGGGDAEVEGVQEQGLRCVDGIEQ